MEPHHAKKRLREYLVLHGIPALTGRERHDADNITVDKSREVNFIHLPN